MVTPLCKLFPEVYVLLTLDWVGPVLPVAPALVKVYTVCDNANEGRRRALNKLARMYVFNFIRSKVDYHPA